MLVEEGFHRTVELVAVLFVAEAVALVVLHHVLHLDAAGSQRLKRVFKIDVSTCIHCGGALRIVASIEEPAAIRAILGHFARPDALEAAHYRPGPRAPPAAAA